MCDRFHRVRVMSGLEVNGSGGLVVTTGMRGPGKGQEKVKPGNPDIGKAVKRGIGGKKAAGNNPY